MSIETRANIGDRVYFIRQMKKVPCPICDGKGSISIGRPISIDSSANNLGEQIARSVAGQMLDCITGNFRTYVCPECKGKGTVKATGQIKYKVESGLVNCIRVDGTADVSETTYYFRSEEGGNFTANDQTLYTDQAKAEYDCRVMNLERRIVPLDKIGVTRAFAETQPHNEKLNKRLDEWRRNGKFDTEIYVTEKGVLFDGYTAFLVYRMLGIENVPVVIWPDDMLDEKRLKPKGVVDGN